jgi:hypothetical protein
MEKRFETAFFNRTDHPLPLRRLELHRRILKESGRLAYTSKNRLWGLDLSRILQGAGGGGLLATKL